MNIKDIVNNARSQAVQEINVDKQMDRLEKKMNTFHFSKENKIAFYTKIILAANHKIDELKKEE